MLLGEAAGRLAGAAQEMADLGVDLRGIYDVSGLRSDADLMVWLTGEEPAAIRAAVMAGAGADATEVADRAEAILRGVDALLPGDALLICGKGHETGQIVGTDPHEPAMALLVARNLLLVVMMVVSTICSGVWCSPV